MAATFFCLHSGCARHTAVQAAPGSSTKLVLYDIDKKPHQVFGDPGTATCLVFFCGCEPCAELADQLHAIGLDSRSSGLFAVVTGGRDIAVRVRDGAGLECPVLLDSDASVSERFDALACPQVRLMGGDGKLIYANQSDRPGNPKELADQLLRRFSQGKWRPVE